MSAILEVKGVNRRFGALQVASDIDLALEPGARHALIGPNGAGKTTLLNLITGMLKPDSGSIALNGEDITALSPEARVKHGLARTFQINQLFKGLSVLDNVMLAVTEQHGQAGAFWQNSSRNSEIIDQSMELLCRLKLEDEAFNLLKELPYGRQRLVEIGITLGLDPKVLLLDEPAAGVPSAESHIILDAIDALDKDIAVMIIEHDMDVVFRFASHITVLVGGAILKAGAPDDIANDDEVRAVYLGETFDA
jgi:ABC-type branched-subunit amino acid transport system ATPase component